MKSSIDRSRMWIKILNLGVFVIYLVGAVLEFKWGRSISVTWPVLQYIYSIVFLIALIRIRRTINSFDKVALNQCYLVMHYAGVLLINITGTAFSIESFTFHEQSAQEISLLNACD